MVVSPDLSPGKGTPLLLFEARCVGLMPKAPGAQGDQKNRRKPRGSLGDRRDREGARSAVPRRLEGALEREKRSVVD